MSASCTGRKVNRIETTSEASAAEVNLYRAIPDGDLK